jgi:putative hemolysin
MNTPLALSLLSLSLSAFFSGLEIAFISANRFELELENKKGDIYYRILSFAAKKPSWFIAAMLVGNNVALVVFGMFMPDLLNPSLDFLSHNPFALLLVQTLLSTAVILLIAEFLPKSLFSSRPMEMLRAFAIPAILFYTLFLPIVAIIVGFSNLFLRVLFGEKGMEKTPSFTLLDLNKYVKEYTDTGQINENEEHEIRIFRNALDLSTNKVRDFIIPRTEIIAMEENENLEKLNALFTEHRVSKILIYRETIDQIIGYIHSFDLFAKPKSVNGIVRPIEFIPESMTAETLLKRMTKDNQSIMVVLDEYGVTAGMITLEDVVEEIFGEIDDEHDVEDLSEKQIDENTYLLSGRLEVDYLNKKYGLNIPSGEGYSTLGGYITHNLERIPQNDEKILLHSFEMIIIKSNDRFVQEIKLIVLQEEN